MTRADPILTDEDRATLVRLGATEDEIRGTRLLAPGQREQLGRRIGGRARNVVLAAMVTRVGDRIRVEKRRYIGKDRLTGPTPTEAAGKASGHLSSAMGILMRVDVTGVDSRMWPIINATLDELAALRGRLPASDDDSIATRPAASRNDSIVTRPCPVDGKPVPVREGSGRQRVYCSDACRQRAHRSR